MDVLGHPQQQFFFHFYQKIFFWFTLTSSRHPLAFFRHYSTLGLPNVAQYPYNFFDVTQYLFNVFSMPLSSFNIFWGHFEFPQLSLEFLTLPISLQRFLDSARCLSKVFFWTLTSILQHFLNIVWCFPDLFPMLPSSPNVHPLIEKNSQCPLMFS